MGIRRFITDLGDLRRGVVALFEEEGEADDRASYRLAMSAQKFTRQTKEVVDDKLAFSATLMRAGEVSAANRLLEEFERDVRNEEAALIETVNEVKVAESMRRERTTRVRLARTLAAATLGSALLTFSAAGMAVAGYLRDRTITQSRPQVRTADVSVPLTEKVKAPHRSMRRLRIGDVHLVLTKSQFAKLRALTGGGSIDETGLRDLLSVLPQSLADRLSEAIGAASTQADEVTSTLETVASEAVKELPKHHHAAKAEAPSDEEAEQPPSDQDQDASPEPKQSPDDDSTPKDGDGGDDDGDGQSPLPLKP